LKTLTIIGGGVLGLMAGVEAIRRGWAVTMISDDDAIVPASLRAGGMLGTQGEAGDVSEFRIDAGLREASFAAWLRFFKDHRFEPTARQTLLVSNEAGCERLHLPHPWLDDRVRRATLMARDWAIDPVALCVFLRTLLARRGAVLEKARARGVVALPNGQYRTQTSGPAVISDGVVVAAGHAAGLIDLPVEGADIIPVAGQMLHLSWPSDQPLDVVIREGDCYLIPRSARSVVIGATVRIGSLDETIEQGERAALSDWAFTIAPPLRHAPVLGEWVGVRPRLAVPQSRLIERLMGRLVWMNGHYRNGILLSAHSAECALDLVEQG
jgi:glycine/D-amino acid oxidase-like deaminating enzyme